MFARKLDKLRRVTIPTALFKMLKFKEFQEVEITIEYGFICIKAFDSNEIAKRPHIGVVRNLDYLKRIVIPAEYLKVLKIEPDTELIITLDGAELKIFSYNKDS